jgi:hypothetical protein
MQVGLTQMAKKKTRTCLTVGREREEKHAKNREGIPEALSFLFFRWAFDFGGLRRARPAGSRA